MKFIKEWWVTRTEPIEPAANITASSSYGGRGEREIQLKLELLLGIPNKKNAELLTLSKGLTAFSMADQDRLLKAVESFAAYPDLTYSLCRNGLLALRELNAKGWQAWLIHIKKHIVEESPAVAVAFVEDIHHYLLSVTPPSQEVSFEQIHAPLTTFLTGLSPQGLKLAVGNVAYTDTTTIYLPPQQSAFPTQQENFDFYKIMLTYLWAQTSFGTWRMDIAEFLYDHQDPDKTIALYRILETLRLDACIERVLPGIARLAQKIGRQSDRLPHTEVWNAAAQRLQQPGAHHSDSMDLVHSLWQQAVPDVAAYQGAFYPREVHRAIRTRGKMHPPDLQNALASLLRLSRDGLEQSKGPFTIRFDEQLSDQGFSNFTLLQDDQPVAMSEQVREAVERIIHDMGTVPCEYLPMDDTLHKTDPYAELEDAAGIVTRLPEWDHALQKYRENWCHIRLKPSTPGDKTFASATRAKHRGVVYQLNRTFEALRESNNISKRQASGDEIDMDLAIEATADYWARKGEMDENIFIRTHKNRRDVAVMFMVDNSSSTHGMVNRVERESLILLCDSLDVLGDRYAVFGFSGNSRKHCDLRLIKNFDEVYSDTVQQRIAGMTANGYTRIGAAVRYLTQRLMDMQATTKLLITLSDGKPDDIDGYRNQYGIEDTRKALLETRAQGILPYCITIDKDAKDYLPYMYGNSSFSVISKVEELPFKMADIYRRITTT